MAVFVLMQVGRLRHCVLLFPNINRRLSPPCANTRPASKTLSFEMLTDCETVKGASAK